MSPWTPKQRSQQIRSRAIGLGFQQCGITPAGPIAHGDYFREWLAQGRAGTMDYLSRRVESRIDVRAWLPSAKSVIVAGLNYRQPSPNPPDDRPRGRVAMYAWGEDYHKVVRERLESLVEQMRTDFAEPFEAKICVDTSAVIERELAAMAGIGWIGKNTLVLHPKFGSYFFVGVIVTDLILSPDRQESDHCGSCTRCIDACPTTAFPKPYQMDARRCISYLTIEHRGTIEPELADEMGEWVFGCDVCQDVCPFNRDSYFSGVSEFGAPDADSAWPGLEEIAGWDDHAYRCATEGKALDRANLEMWRRNAKIAAKNQKEPRPSE